MNKNKIIKQLFFEQKSVKDSLFDYVFSSVNGGEPVEQYENVFGNLSLETRNDDNIFWKNLSSTSDNTTSSVSNGWRNFTFVNENNTQSPLYIQFQPNPSAGLNIKTSTKYTIFFEIANYESETLLNENQCLVSINDTYGVHNTSLFIEPIQLRLNTLKENTIYKRLVTTHDDFTDKLYLIRSIMNQVAGAKPYSVDLRVWIVEGDYTSTGNDKDLPFKYANQGLPYYSMGYIESTGSQYIDLGIPINNNYGMYLKGSFTQYIDSEYVIGGVLSGVNRFAPLFPQQNMFFYNDTLEYSRKSYNKTYNTDIHEIEYNVYPSREIKFNQEYVANAVDEKLSSTNLNMFLFTRNVNGNPDPVMSYYKLYNLKLNLENNLIMDLIPCIVKSTGEIGMWDLVSNKFFGNSGSGTFSYGYENIFDGIIYDYWVNFDANTLGKLEGNKSIIVETNGSTIEFVSSIIQTRLRTYEFDTLEELPLDGKTVNISGTNRDNRTTFSLRTNKKYLLINIQDETANIQVFKISEQSHLLNELRLLGIESSGDIEDDKSQLNELGIEV